MPTVHVAPRRKIKLDETAIHAARNQHAGTVELLNEYLQDAPAVSAKLPKTTTPTRAAKPSKSAPKVPKTLTAPSPAAAGNFTSGLGLSASQQALL